MFKYLRKTLVILLFVTIVAVSGYFLFIKKKQVESSQLSASIPQPTGSKDQESTGFKTFTFNNFHGSTDISDKFQFEYPMNWHNDGQYFSPQKIEFYDRYSVKAPIYFDLILADIFHLTEFQYQINNSKRRTPDTIGQIGDKDFKRYDLIDYGSYGGDSAGLVKIFVGPKIKIDGADYYLVFHWEEKPLAEYMPGNSIDFFDNMLLTLKFFK